MDVIDRREFLVRSGLASKRCASRHAECLPSPDRALLPRAVTIAPDWQAVRDQFPALTRSDPPCRIFSRLPSRRRCVRPSSDTAGGLDADPIGYWLAHEKEQEATVLRAAADYLGVDPTEIALTDSTTMGLGLLYGGLALQPRPRNLTTTHDHYSTETSLRLRAERTGATVRRIPLYEELSRVTQESLVEKLVKAVRRSDKRSWRSPGCIPARA